MTERKDLFNESNAAFDEAEIDDLVVTESLTITGATLNWNHYDNSSIGFLGQKLQVKDLGISTSKIKDLAVTTAKIADEAVTDDKIHSVSASKIIQPFVDLEVTNSINIEGATLVMDQLDNTTIQLRENKLEVKDLGISTAKIQGSAVTTSKLAPSSVSTSKIQDEAVTDEKIFSVSAEKIVQPFIGLEVDGEIKADSINPYSLDRDFVIVGGAQIASTTFNNIDIGSLASTVVTNSGKISTLQGQVATNTGKITTNTGKIALLEDAAVDLNSRTTDLEARADATDITLTNLDNDLGLVEGRLDTLEPLVDKHENWLDQSVKTDSTPTFTALNIDEPFYSGTKIELGEDVNSPYILVDAGIWGGFRLYVERNPWPEPFPPQETYDYAFHPHGQGGYIVNSKSRLNWDMDAHVASTNSSLATLQTADAQNVKLTTTQTIPGNKNFMGRVVVPYMFVETVNRTIHALSGTSTLVDFSSDTHHLRDPYNFYDASQHAFIAPYICTCTITCQVAWWSSTPVGGTRSIYLHKNGALYKVDRFLDYAGNKYQTASFPCFLEAGDVITMRMDNQGSVDNITGSTTVNALYQRHVMHVTNIIPNI